VISGRKEEHLVKLLIAGKRTIFGRHKTANCWEKESDMGIRRTGLGWDWGGRDCMGLGWTGLEWTGLGWDWGGRDWDGTGVDGTGMDGTGVEGTGVDGTRVDGTGRMGITLGKYITADCCEVVSIAV
jgi:hypothetical protein